MEHAAPDDDPGAAPLGVARTRQAGMGSCQRELTQRRLH